MPSAKQFALLSIVLTALFLLLRPVVGRLGAPTPPDTRGYSEAKLPESVHPVPVRAPSPPPPPTPTAAVSHLEEVERLVLDATNEERASHGGLPPLAPEEILRSTSRDHNADMLARGFFDHVNPDGDAPADRIAKAHRRLVGLTGENIWMGSGYGATPGEELAEKIVESWMKSPGHRANILESRFTHLGVGVSVVGDEVRATQNFARVEALIRENVPAKVPRGTVLEMTLSSPTGRAASARQFDLFSTARGLEVAGPLDLSGAAIDVAPGSYRLRFYFPRGDGGYVIYPGPQIEVE